MQAEGGNITIIMDVTFCKPLREASREGSRGRIAGFAAISYHP